MSDFPTPGAPGPPSAPGSTGAPAPGWWQASDGNWYPPDQSPGYATAPGYAGNVGYGYGYPVQAPAGGTNGFAIASLIASIVSCGLGSILGVIFGHVALNQMKSSGEGGRGLAIAGLVIGYIGIVAIIIAVIVIIAAAGDDSSEFRFESIVGSMAR